MEASSSGAKESNSLIEGEGPTASSESQSWLQKDISDEELSIIMNRDLLFDVNSALYTAFTNASLTISSNSTNTISGTNSSSIDDAAAIVLGEDGEDRDAHQELQIGRIQEGESGKEDGEGGEEAVRVDEPTAVKVRVEGEMYDIITTSADEIFSSIR